MESVEQTIKEDQNGRAIQTGMYQYSSDGITGYGATPQAAKLNWQSQVTHKATTP